jgi:hypothetical protein
MLKLFYFTDIDEGIFCSVADIISVIKFSAVYIALQDI